MFTIYMTVSNIGHVVGNLAAGWRDPDRLNLSYEVTFVIAAVTVILPLLLLPFVRPDEVDRLKEQEREADVV